jgi:hypothetical protein
MVIQGMSIQLQDLNTFVSIAISVIPYEQQLVVTWLRFPVFSILFLSVVSTPLT